MALPSLLPLSLCCGATEHSYSPPSPQHKKTRTQERGGVGEEALPFLSSHQGEDCSCPVPPTGEDFPFCPPPRGNEAFSLSSSGGGRRMYFSLLPAGGRKTRFLCSPPQGTFQPFSRLSQGRKECFFSVLPHGGRTLNISLPQDRGLFK